MAVAGRVDDRGFVHAGKRPLLNELHVGFEALYRRPNDLLLDESPGQIVAEVSAYDRRPGYWKALPAYAGWSQRGAHVHGTGAVLPRTQGWSGKAYRISINDTKLTVCGGTPGRYSATGTYRDQRLTVEFRIRCVDNTEHGPFTFVFRYDPDTDRMIDDTEGGPVTWSRV